MKLTMIKQEKNLLQFKPGLLAAIGLALLTSTAQAAETHSTLLYISPTEYKYSAHLLSPYYADYWFEQGPLVEPIALSTLKAKDGGGLSLCKANETADTIISLRPSIFYNPQLKVYHSRMQASVYSGKGDFLGSYEGEAQQQGFVSFDNGRQYHIKKVYQLAMNDLVRKFDFKQLEVSTAQKLPCGIVGAQIEPKVHFY